MNGTPCIVTKPCLDTMTHFGCPYYSLSHQLLYFMVGKMVRWKQSHSNYLGFGYTGYTMMVKLLLYVRTNWLYVC